MKTAELKGVALDWAVAKCEGKSCNTPYDYDYNFADYSTNWALAGLIIEHEGIELWCSLLGQPNHVEPMWQKSHWRAKYFNKGVGDNVVFDGTTPLEAAMRCYVASKLGNEIDIPEELV